MKRETKAKMKTYFIKKLGSFEYRRGWMKSDCPICGGEFKFGINLQMDRCHCFKCEYDQRAINLVMHLENAKYYEAMSIINDFKESRYNEKPLELIERKPAILPHGFRLIKEDDESILGKRAYRYVTIKRGLTINMVKRMKLGYVKDVHSSHYNHLIIPFYSSRQLVYFQSRNIGDGIKFNNPKVEEFGIGKNSLIYNVDALLRYREVSIVESAINVLTIAPKAVSILSKSVSRYQLNVLNLSPVGVFNIILDPDAIGKAIELGLSLVSKHSIRIVMLPEDRDVNDMGREYTMEQIKKTPILSWKGLMQLKSVINNPKFNYERTQSSYYS